MMKLVDTAYAKINLALHVRRREADGYHRIETLFAFADHGDRLELSDGEGLSVGGPFGGQISADADNLVLRAARAYGQAFGRPVGAFALEKNLPVAAGIGGGSADAAAALRLLCRRDGRDPLSPPVVAIAAALGADVPACLHSVLSRGTGRGDRIERLDDVLRGTAVLLVNPRVPVPTGPVFAAWDGVDRGALGTTDPLADALAGRNDLEPPARRLQPVIGEVVDWLRARPGARLARMSGSGATCFALFDDAPACEEAAAALGQARPDWWRLSARLR